MRLGGSRFVAGETADDAVRVLRALNDRGLWANTTLLGEGIRDEEEARAVADDYVALVDRLANERLRPNVPFKITHLSLKTRKGNAFGNILRVLRLGTLCPLEQAQ